MKEEAVTTTATQEQAEAQQKIDPKAFTEYKKRLRADVEILELQARHVKARLDYLVYNAELAHYQAELTKIQKEQVVDNPPEEKKIIPIKKNLKEV